jgi:hypothetical protein
MPSGFADAGTHEAICYLTVPFLPARRQCNVLEIITEMESISKSGNS